MCDLPSGTVTFLFTDIEGSTRLLDELGADAYSAALADHRRLLREAVTSHGGVEVDTQGDAFLVAFADAAEAAAAARRAQEALAEGPINVRMGLHTGEARLSGEGYVGRDVHLGARVCAAGHGGQVLLSRATRDLLGGADVMDLGEHRLKDFADPVWIFQLGSERFPPLRTISNTNLPRPASSFVGREREVAEVRARLVDGARMLTLTGPGGTGKTRLSLEVAAELVPEFKSGVFWVDLAPLRESALVPETIAQVLGAKDGLAGHIGEREMLLVLDNMEQVVESAPELAALLMSCPNLRLLNTSRELLRVRGEVAYTVPPLASQESVELFGARSGLSPDDTIAELCRRLDNLPLAIELAAARASVLSPAQILDRLSKRLDLFKGGRDTGARQQTLRATIAWSYDLLRPDEQRLFARLSAFRGGWTLESAEQVTDADLDVLQSLVDKSLIGYGGNRFEMLETIREFATERLDASAESNEIRRGHARYFLALVEEAEPNLGESTEWVERLEREHGNIRAGLDYLQTCGDGAIALRFAAALAEFWYLGGHLREGRDSLEGALAAERLPTAVRAKALNGAAWMLVESGDPATGARRAEEALSIYRELGDSRGIAESLLELGVAISEQGDHGSALPILEEGVQRFRELGDEQSLVIAVRNLAGTYHDAGDLRRAWALHEDNLKRSREMNDARAEAMSLGQLARIAVDEGRVEEALPMLRAQLRVWRDLGMPLALVVSLCRFARALAIAGEAVTAVRLLSAAHALLNNQLPRTGEVAKTNQETLSATHAQLDETTFAEAWEQGQKLTEDQAVALALDTEPNA
jgi:predicted ATPase